MILIEQHYYLFISDLPSKPVFSPRPVLIERCEVLRHVIRVVIFDRVGGRLCFRRCCRWRWRT